MKQKDLYARLELISTDLRQSKTVSDLYARLELVPTDLEQSETVDTSKLVQVWRASKEGLKRVGSSLLNYFSGSMEPRISVKRDRNGNASFAAYDPIDCAHHTFNSEEAVRVWLEQRYYNR
ncbi:MAG: hypothetical protein F6K42_07670 [Leptolyngbya sp. SIO1D8]|nr:hypothetical protein [Leptolyngbya sp. SIO1D8]